MELLQCQDSVKNCVGWMFDLLPQVGSAMGNLLHTPTAQDIASRVGSESQRYTTWNCISRLYIGGVVIADAGVQPNEAHNAEQDRHEEYDVPTQEAPAPDPNLGFFYPDTIPVRVATISTFVSKREEEEPVPFSPIFQALAGRLNDPAQTDVLTSVVRGPNVPDATSLTSLVKAMELFPSTRHEVAPLVRAVTMQMSLAEESFSLDPISHRFVRKAIHIEKMGMNIVHKPNFVANEWKVIAMGLDTFMAIANNSFADQTPLGYGRDTLDQDWVAVPVTSMMINQSWLLTYIACFLSSDFWSGTVNYIYRTRRLGPAVRNYTMTETYLPCANSVHIPGPKRVALYWLMKPVPVLLVTCACVWAVWE